MFIRWKGYFDYNSDCSGLIPIRHNVALSTGSLAVTVFNSN
jgi:hypothetical protein